MEETQKKRGRPRLSEEEKKQRAALRKSGELPTVTRPDRSLENSELTSPGDNSRFLVHAMATMNLPKINRNDPKQVEARINWYLNHCLEHDMKPTVTGFCNALGICRQTLWNWRNGAFRAGTHEEIICKAYDLLEEMWENYMMNGKINPVAGIFLGKNMFGYQDKQEYVLTPNQNQVEAVDAATIEAKYAELPDLED